VVRLLWLEYYRYPSPKHPSLISFVNHPTKVKAVHGPDGELFPDIVVLDAKTEKLVLAVEVETESSVEMKEAPQWSAFSSACGRLHLYVPRGFAARAVSLCPGRADIEFIEYHKKGQRYIIERYA
jgi:hypothetical protein